MRSVLVLAPRPDTAGRLNTEMRADSFLRSVFKKGRYVRVLSSLTQR